MKRIVDIVPARPGWYARWQLTPDATRCYPVTVWALIEDTDEANREVIGVDSVGQWPGADDNEAGGEFVRYLFQAPESGEPDDAERFDAERSDAERSGAERSDAPGAGNVPAAPRRHPVATP